MSFNGAANDVGCLEARERKPHSVRGCFRALRFGFSQDDPDACKWHGLSKQDCLAECSCSCILVLCCNNVGREVRRLTWLAIVHIKSRGVLKPTILLQKLISRPPFPFHDHGFNFTLRSPLCHLEYMQKSQAISPFVAR